MSEPMILKVTHGFGFDKGRQIPVPPSGAILGRGSSSDIKLDEITLSKVHCRFALENGKWVVEDFNSRCGVVVNGQKTSGSPLKQGDKIQLGRLHLEVVSLPASGDTIRFPCKCGKVYTVKASLAGEIVVCEQCGVKTKVPKATALAFAAPAKRARGVEPRSPSAARPDATEVIDLSDIHPDAPD